MKGNDTRKALWKARHDAVTIETESWFKEFLAGRGRTSFLMDSAGRLLKVQLELCTRKADRALVRETHLRLVKMIYDINAQRFKAGRIPIMDFKFAEFDWLDAEFDLERERGD
jgi:hypothetical protein